MPSKLIPQRIITSCRMCEHFGLNPQNGYSYCMNEDAPRHLFSEGIPDERTIPNGCPLSDAGL